MKTYEDLTSDPRLFSGSPAQRASIRERLHRKYNQVLEEDLPVHPTLDNLLYGSCEDQIVYDMPLFFQHTGADTREPVSGCSPDFGAVSNTPPTKHENRKLGVVCMGGYDGGFESGFQGTWNPEIFSRLIERLNSRRVEGEVSTIEIEGRHFVLKAHGAGGGERVYYRYIIEGGGWRVYFHHEPSTQFQPVRVRFGFECLCGCSLYDVHDEFMFWLRKIGFTVTEEKISRIDLQVMTTRPVIEYASLVAQGCVVKRAKKGNFHVESHDMSSFAFGSDIYLRCYDKRKQLFDTCDEYGLKMIAEYCCGGELPDHLTRIEFQIRREVLEILGIDTIEDLRDSELSLVEWLTFDWFRLTNGVSKKGHTREQEVAAIWQEVRNAFFKYFPGGNNNRIITRSFNEVVVNCTSEDLVSQAVGCMATVASRAKITLEKDFVLNYVIERIREHSEELFSKVQERA
ncbi:MAG: hypothetical protein LBC20_09735, partial [Planctomycetaceae bacterium]|nr:hypothetical protein [Planctomycetaceae bacterium]